jgi:hypothetical protein
MGFIIRFFIHPFTVPRPFYIFITDINQDRRHSVLRPFCPFVPFLFLDIWSPLSVSSEVTLLLRWPIPRYSIAILVRFPFFSAIIWSLIASYWQRIGDSLWIHSVDSLSSTRSFLTTVIHENKASLANPLNEIRKKQQKREIRCLR